ncbi:uncharacterized protein LOC110240703 [Exaiptasia diaphana]|uniref:Uncharacterized protein n=1 Tax=Exaiptasia diaphana TaxID=2652724 RepID=A0A913XC15_EXADI|nr:uncharacterized protein LOC110240703 [Exaiptasia diaphana]
MEDLLNKYQKPKNCGNLISPKVNKAVWLQLKTDTKNGDHAMQKAQKFLIHSTYALLEGCQKASDDLRTTLHVHALVLLLSGNRELNIRRRELLKPDLNARYAALCNPTTPITSELFGDDVSKEIDDLSKANKLGKKLATPSRIKRGFHPYGSYRNRFGRDVSRRSGNSGRYQERQQSFLAGRLSFKQKQNNQSAARKDLNK